MLLAPDDPHASEGAASAGLPQFAFETWPAQIFWALIAFGLLYLLLSRVLLWPIGGVIEDRRDKIADDLDDATRFKRQAEAAEEALEQSLNDARARAHSFAAQTRERLAEETARDSAAVDAELNKRAAAAEKQIAEAVNAALANVNEVATDAAGAIVEKLSGSPANAASIAKAIQAQTRS